MSDEPIRKNLGDFSSIVCLKAIVVGIEDALGEKAATIALIAAGRRRGKDLAQQLGLSGKSASMTMDDLQQQAAQHLGKEGTRLCVIDKIVQDGDTYKVYLQETICSSGELQGSDRNCSYTLGAVQGFLEACLSKRLRGKQIESVLRGGTHDVIQYTVY